MQKIGANFEEIHEERSKMGWRVKIETRNKY